MLKNCLLRARHMILARVSVKAKAGDGNCPFCANLPTPLPHVYICRFSRLIIELHEDNFLYVFPTTR